MRPNDNDLMYYFRKNMGENVLKMTKYKILLVCIFIFMILVGCANDNFWQTNNIMIQMYNQINQETTLGFYNQNLNNTAIVKKANTAVAYIDNYRKETIFVEQDGLEYMINDRKVITTDKKNDIDGYVVNVLSNEFYQIGIEILGVNIDDVDSDEFGGAKTRIIDLNTKKNIIVNGLLYNRSLIQGNYLYSLVFDFDENEYLEVINLKDMTSSRRRTEANNISFLYEVDNNVYVQSNTTKTSFLITDGKYIEQKDNFSDILPTMGDGEEIIKNVGMYSQKYLVPEKVNEIISNAYIINIQGNGVFKKQKITFTEPNIIQIMDSTFLPNDKIAVFYVTKDENGELAAIISIFDENNIEVEKKDVTNIRKDIGRFNYIDCLL